MALLPKVPPLLPFSHPLDPQCHDKEQVSIGDVPFAPQALRNGSLCCSQSCPPSPAWAIMWVLAGPDPGFQIPLKSGKPVPRGWKLPILRGCLIPPSLRWQEKGPASPSAQAALWIPLNTHARTNPMDYFISQVINWAASPEPLLLLPGHISEINLRANEANYQHQTWSLSNYFPWKGHPKWHIVKPS